MDPLLKWLIVTPGNHSDGSSHLSKISRAFLAGSVSINVKSQMGNEVMMALGLKKVKCFRGASGWSLDIGFYNLEVGISNYAVHSRFPYSF